jgi:uncharacterized protein YkwD
MPIILILAFIIGCLLVVYLNRSKPTLPKEAYIPVPSNQNSVLLTLINNERVQNGLPELVPEELLTSICEEKCNEMIASKSVDHDGFSNRFVKSRALTLLENVGYGFSTDNSIFHAYMKSPGHKANILSKNTTHIGIYTKNSYNCCLFARY